MFQSLQLLTSDMHLCCGVCLEHVYRVANFCNTQISFYIGAKGYTGPPFCMRMIASSQSMFTIGLLQKA